MRFIYLEPTDTIYEITGSYGESLFSVRRSRDNYSFMLNLAKHRKLSYIILEDLNPDEKIKILQDEVKDLQCELNHQKSEIQDMKKWIDRLEQDVDFNRGGFIS